MVVVVALVMGLIGQPEVRSHSVATFYDRGPWQTQYLLLFGRNVTHWTNGPGWNSTRRTRIEDAASRWNAVSTNRYWNYRFQGHRSDLNLSCLENSFNKNGHHWRKLPGSRIGQAQRCYSGGRLHNFQIIYDTSTTWYFGTGVPSRNAFDFYSTAVHELGHGTGFRGHFTGPSTCPGTSSDNTMCQSSARRGTTHRRSLGTHDRHTFQHAYS